ncbi:MAG TPA: hypothetical protein VIL07_12750 [Symbiobacteriaceae bacterium]
MQVILIGTVAALLALGESGARYFSRLSSDEVLRFYRKVAKPGEVAREGQSIRLPVHYKGSEYLILFTPQEPGGVDLQIDTP